jgi:hypothetical protein
LRHSIPRKDFALYSVLTKRAGGSGEFKKILKKNKTNMKLAKCNFIVYSLSVSVFSIGLFTEDERSMSVFLVYWQLSQSQMANFPAFIASKSFDLSNHHIP